MAFGPGIQPSGVVAGFPTSFVIETRDAIGNRVPHGGSIFALTVISGPTTSISFQIADNNNGDYTVVYTPAIPGNYVFSIKLGGIENIAGSPFPVAISGATNPATSALTCQSWGDPHFVMFNGNTFNFQGYGEYVLAQLGDLDVQVRQQPCASGVTCNMAVWFTPRLLLSSSRPPSLPCTTLTHCLYRLP